MPKIVEVVTLPEEWYAIRCRAGCGVGRTTDGQKYEVMSEDEARRRAEVHMELTHHAVEVLFFGEGEDAHDAHVQDDASSGGVLDLLGRLQKG